MFNKSFVILFLLIFFSNGVAQTEERKSHTLYDLSLGGVAIDLASKPHLNLEFYELGIPLIKERLFLSAPIATVAVSPVFSRDTHHMSLNMIPSIVGAAYLLTCEEPLAKKSKIFFGALTAPHLISNLKLSFYHRRFNLYLRQKTDFHLIDRTKRGLYSELAVGGGVTLWKDWSLGLYGSLPFLKTLPYKPQKPYIGARIYLGY